MILTGITCEAAEMKKIILIVVDGMRPDGMISCGHPLIGQLKKRCKERLLFSIIPPVWFTSKRPLLTAVKLTDPEICGSKME